MMVLEFSFVLEIGQRFEAFDYGAEENLQHYGQTEPIDFFSNYKLYSHLPLLLNNAEHQFSSSSSLSIFLTTLLLVCFDCC